MFRSALLWPVMAPLTWHIKRALRRSERPGGVHEHRYGRYCDCGYMHGFEEVVSLKSPSGPFQNRPGEVGQGKGQGQGHFGTKGGGRWRFKDMGWK